jgi:hypothetical protein
MKKVTFLVLKLQGLLNAFFFKIKMYRSKEKGVFIKYKKMKIKN